MQKLIEMLRQAICRLHLLVGKASLNHNAVCDYVPNCIIDIISQPTSESLPRRPAANSKKVRVGYLSGELREQATSHLITGVFELHDNSQFEIYGFDNGWDDNSAIRRRINASVHNPASV